MRVDQRRHDILIVDDLFSSGELAILGLAAESATFDVQELGRGTSSSRSRLRGVIEDEEIAGLLWSKLAPLLAPVASWYGDQGGPLVDPPIDKWKAVGCNNRSRFYRYEIGGSFSPHQDEAWRPHDSLRSLLTVLVYLPAGGCVGGDTVVDGEVIGVADGRIAVFEHSLLHEGKPVERGQKLVLRNDVIAEPFA